MVLLTAPGTPRHQNYFHARGSQIVDSHGKVMRLTGVSWWGLETDKFAPLGLDKRRLDDIVSEVQAMGFNTLRIPYSNEALRPQAEPQGINYDLNPQLRGLSPLEVMDHVIFSAHVHGLRVILDRHRPGASGQSDLWYTPEHSEQEWIDDWKMLAVRYRNDDTVIGCDLHNEPHGKATWGSGDNATDWRLAAERAGDAVLSVNPHLLILVEGVSEVSKDSYWWGGNLSAAGRFPVRLNRPSQLVYSAHDYPPSVSSQAWFSAPEFPANLPTVWREHWGYLAEEDRVPVVLSEFGTHYVSTVDRQWMASLVEYLANNHISAMYWSLNPESEDTGGLFQQDWHTVDDLKLAALQPLLPTHRIAPAIKMAALTTPLAPQQAAQPVIKRASLRVSE